MKKIAPIAVAAASLAGTGVGLRALTNYMVNKSEYVKPQKGLKITKELKMIAHRGFSSAAPENSLAAYHLAGEMGFKYAECDIRKTKDNEWILMHDKTLDRMTDGKGLVSEKTISQIKELKYIKGANIKLYGDEKIPALAEFLEVCKLYNITPVIEIKDEKSDCLHKLLDTISEYEMIDKTIIIDYCIENLKVIRTLCPEIELMILCKVLTKSVILTADEIGNCGVNVFHSLLIRNKALTEVFDRGIALSRWTVDTKRALLRAHKLGVSFVTTNSLVPCN